MYELLRQQLREVPVPERVKRRAVRNLRSLEREGIENADAVVFQSEEDRTSFESVQSFSDTVVKTIPNGCDFDSITAGGDPRAVARNTGISGDNPVCIFVGAYDYEPNRIAADAIANEIAPSLSEVDFLLLGRNPLTVTGKNLYTPGYVEDLPGALSLADIALCPLTKGAGTKLKMMDYLAAGLPVVTTEMGAQGIPLEDGRTALIRNTPADMVQAIRRLIESPELQSDLSSNAESLGRQFSWESLMNGYDELVTMWFE